MLFVVAARCVCFFFLLLMRLPLRSTLTYTLFPYTSLCRSLRADPEASGDAPHGLLHARPVLPSEVARDPPQPEEKALLGDGRSDPHHRPGRHHVFLDADPSPPAGIGRQAAARFRVELKIGRAQCRARVCQYV